MNILIFDAFYSKVAAGNFLQAIPEHGFIIDIVYGEKVESADSKIWKTQWQFYDPKRCYEYAPTEIRFPNGKGIRGCLHIVDLGMYFHLLQTVNKDALHEGMAGDHLNSIKWAKRYDLMSMIVVLEDEKKLTGDVLFQIKSIYGLSNDDLILRTSITQPEAFMEMLTEITQRFNS